MLIRQATVNDSEAIVYFIRSMLQDLAAINGQAVNPDATVWSNFLTRVVAEIEEPNELYLCAESDGEIVGYLEGSIVQAFELYVPVKSFHVSVVYVLPKNRRLGIATRLIETALQWSGEKGCQEANLNVLVQNEAQYLYEKLGFSVAEYKMKRQISNPN
ncbi:GNAT family N-acetyltransferase [Leptolyngbya sp. FACHB-36]|uniref:GNAT family N-acetyltransferase n=1 Tax=Leptolyngbya sp. FACHB-36 TaxID=2692808 RepID=UPI00168163CC|nr:GNAT family N-acetyltransferase [Leptolyngbya sp. FACHB-36]MBD2020115.1 GNAT family N-acetyltransferase [Leptolyngbya sp. FACHB-36]